MSVKLLWLIPPFCVAAAMVSRRVLPMALFTPSLLLIILLTKARDAKGAPDWQERWLAVAGLAMTIAGDFFLVFCKSAVGSEAFLYGVDGFAAAQICWILSMGKNRPNLLAAFALAVPYSLFFFLRLRPALPNLSTAIALGTYTVLSLLGCSFALGGLRKPGGRTFAAGLLLLLLSDTAIGLRIVGYRHLGPFVGASYVVALALIARGIQCAKAARLPAPPRKVLRTIPYVMAGLGVAAMAAFAWAMRLYPGGGFNPLRTMLSRLGRPVLSGVDFPACNIFFSSGLLAAAIAAALLFPAIRIFIAGKRRRPIVALSGSLNIAGLLTIALVPENFIIAHWVGCALAACGGGIAIVAMSFDPPRCGFSNAARKTWLTLGVLVIGVFQLFLALHKLKVIRFAPWVPSAQKAIILTYILWMVFLGTLLFVRFLPKAARR
jgi:hypothetical protein